MWQGDDHDDEIDLEENIGRDETGCRGGSPRRKPNRKNGTHCWDIRVMLYVLCSLRYIV
jgi:hypothetical protein